MTKSQIQALADDLSGALPLGVDTITWEGESLSIAGSRWRFTTMCSWRLFVDGSFRSSTLSNADHARSALKGRELRKVCIRRGAVIDDVQFHFSGNVVLELFFDLPNEPCYFKIDDRHLIPATLDD